MSESKRKVFTGAQRAKFAIEAVNGTKTINGIVQEHREHPNQVSQWKKELMENAGRLFEGKRGPKAVNAQSDPAPVIRQDRSAEYRVATPCAKMT